MIGQQQRSAATPLALGEALAIEARLERQLERIGERVLSRPGPHRGGLLCLEKACEPGIARERRKVLLQGAQDSFIDAVARLEKVDPVLGAWAAIHVAGVCQLLEQPTYAQRWAARAYEDAVLAAHRKCELASDRVALKVGKRLRVTDGRRRAGRARGELEELARFVEDLGNLRLRLGTRRVPVHALSFNSLSRAYSYA
jgi:hypothetical protein